MANLKLSQSSDLTKNISQLSRNRRPLIKSSIIKQIPQTSTNSLTMANTMPQFKPVFLNSVREFSGDSNDLNLILTGCEILINQFYDIAYSNNFQKGIFVEFYNFENKTELKTS